MNDVGPWGCGFSFKVQFVTSGFSSSHPGSGHHIRVPVSLTSGLLHCHIRVTRGLCQVVESETRASHPIEGAVRLALGVPSSTQASAQ